jgi:tripartite-type tricarboxylate transporter receptor subunit TctC
MEFYPRIARGAMAPKTVSRDILKRLESSFLDTTSKAEFKAKMEQAGFVPQVWGIAESQKYLESESKLLNKLIQDFDLLQPTK